MATEKDKDSVGLTKEGQARLAELELTGWFGDGQDLARFCLAYAIRTGVGVGTARADTRWTVGLFDKSNEIRILMEALFPDCETPVRQMEFLIDEGLKLVSEQVTTHHATPADLVTVSGT